MLNKEKYAKEIIDIICNTGELPAVIKGRPYNCEGKSCEDCEFYNTSCCNGFKEWANSECVEHEIDWTKVPIDTPVYVRDFSIRQWNKRHFHKFDKDNEFYYCYCDGQTSWTSEEDDNNMCIGWRQCKLAEGVDCSEWYKD